MSENTDTKKTPKKKCLKEIGQDIDILKERQIPTPSLEKIISDREKQTRFTIDLINYLTAELANTKEEIELLRKLALSTKESH
jgi:hypothetical protein